MKTKKTVVYIIGCWDLLHVGHIEILEKTKALGDYLIVRVFTDDVIAAEEYKGYPPVIPCEDRVRMLMALKCVDLAIPLEKREYLEGLKKYNPDILVIGEYWGNHRWNIEAEEYMRAKGGNIVQFPYTKRVSTTLIKQKIKEGIWSLQG